MFKTLIKVHLGLLKYLVIELKKKRTPKELIFFLRDILKRYFAVILQEYKNSFLILDPEYRKQKKLYEKQNQLKKDLQRALKLLEYIDVKMAKSGVNRTARRQFFRDFYKNGQVRKDIYEELLKELK